MEGNEFRGWFNYRSADVSMQRATIVNSAGIIDNRQVAGEFRGASALIYDVREDRASCPGRQVPDESEILARSFFRPVGRIETYPEKYHRAAVFSSSPFRELARPLCASDVRTNGRIHPERVSFRSSSTKRAAERHRRLQLLREGSGGGGRE